MDRGPGPQRAGRTRPRRHRRRRSRARCAGPGRAVVDGVGGQEAQHRPVPPGGRARRQGSHAVVAPAGHRPDRPRDGHGGGGLSARRLDRRVRAAAAARADGPADARHRRARGDGARRGRGRGGGGGRRVRHGGQLPAAHRLGGHGAAARRHRDPAGARAGQNGSGRHRHRPGRAAGDRRLARGVGGHAAGRGAEAGRPRVQRQLDAAAAHRPLRGDRPHARQEDEDRLLDRRPDPGEPPRHASDCGGPAELPRGGEAALDLRREPVGRSPGGRPHPRVVRPDGGADRPHLVGPSQPAQHPGAQRHGQAVPPGLRAAGRLELPRGRLRPGGAALHRPPVGRPGAHRRADARVRRAPDGGGRRLRHCARGRDAHPARVLQDGLLRPGLRHGGLRSQPAPRGPRRRGGRHHGELLRRLPAGEGSTWTGRWSRPRSAGRR